MPINADDIKLFVLFDGFTILNLPIMVQGDLLKYQGAYITHENESYRVFGRVADDVLTDSSVKTTDPNIAWWLYNLDRPLVIRW